MAEFTQMVEIDYGIKRKGATTCNPQANAIIERIHQTLGNMLQTFEIHKSEMTPEDSWEGILSAVMFASRATYHTTLQASPSQLVFGRDAITNIQFEANWTHIKQLKQRLISKNNQRENSKRISHTYKKGDKVLFKEIQKSKYGQNPYSGPHEVLSVNDNGTVILKKGIVIQPLNIRLIKPYYN